MKHILVIDDDANIRLILERFLEKQGFSVDSAEDGSIGLEKIEEKLPDLVVTDIMMPNTDGLEVVLSIRNNHPDTPVIAISGGIASASVDLLPVAKKMGSSKVKVLYKPVELSSLLSNVHELLGEPAANPGFN